MTGCCEFPKRIEHALIKYISKLSHRVQLALSCYFHHLEKQVPQFRVKDYRLDIGWNLPHVLAPLPLLGTYCFNIEKLYFDIKLNNPFREDIRTLFSSKILMPALSLTLSSFVTVHRWVGRHLQDVSNFIVHVDRPFMIQKGDYSFLNFYHFRSLTPLKICDADYLDMILRDMLIFLMLLPLPTIRNKLQDLCKLLPYLSIYGTDISGVEALSVTRGLLKIDRRSLESGYCKKVPIRSLLWKEMSAYRTKALLVTNDSLSGNLRIMSNETIYIPELYFIRFLKKYDADALLIDSIIMSLFIIRRVSGDPQRDLMLFNILAMPLNIYSLDNNEATLAVLNYVTAGTCSSQFANAVIEKCTLLERALGTSIVISEGDLTLKLRRVLNALRLRQAKLDLSPITIKLNKGLPLSGVLSYAYAYLLPFLDSLESQYQKNAVSLSCYPPYVLSPILAYALLKNVDFETFKELMRRTTLTLRRKSQIGDAMVLVTLKDEWSKILRDYSHVEYSEIRGLMRDIMLAWRLYAIRLKYSQQMLKYENGRGGAP